MTTTTIIKIETKTGKVAAEVKRTEHANGRISHGWMGAWGAGSGALEDIVASLKVSMATRKGWTVTVGSIA